jgi:diguanylate cyclase (GGDEF)-like protein
LIVDDDPAVLELVSVVLKDDGFDVEVCSNADDVVRRSLEWSPDVVILDVMMPSADGFSVCRRLRHEFATRSVCIVMLTAKVSSADKLVGLRAGADDYVTKPFDPEEMVGRVRAAMRRCRERTGLNPLTGFPGNTQIHQAIKDALAWEEPFALLHVDIDGFKAFNDHYNVIRGDRAIKMLADCVSEAVRDSGTSRGFVGHVGGDDFAVVVEADLGVPIASHAIALWDGRVAELYDEADRLRRFIRVRDRQKRTTKYPLMRLSIGIATSTHRSFETHLQAADIAAELKQIAKRDPVSAYAIDRRHGKLLEGSVPPYDPRGVIIVDDDEDQREIIRLHCEFLGFKIVAEAANGIEAIELASQHLPTFVIMDQKMPRMDGDAAAAQIRDAVPGVTIVAFTAVLGEKPEWADEFLKKEEIAELTPLLGKLLDERLGARTPAPPPPS